jgi:tetratricopeptide (TPR) repeat protein
MNPEEELIELNIELAHNPNNEGAKKAKVHCLCHKAITMASNDKIDEAIELVDQALEIEPENTQLLLNKADYLSKKNKHTEAIEYASKVFEMEPENFKAKYRLAAYLNNSFEEDMACGILTFLFNC